MNKIFPAHIKIKEGQAVIQDVQTHCRHTAELAEACLHSVGLGRTAYLAGLLHDCGKFTQVFSEYIQKAVDGENVHRGSVNHTFAGVKFLLDNYYQNGCDTEDKLIKNLTCEILAYVIGSHHGLFDSIDDDKKSGLLYRKNKTDIHYEEAMKNMYDSLADKKEIDALYLKSMEEIKAYFNIFQSITKRADELLFYIGLVCRLVLAAVIEGDRKDTATFMENIGEEKNAVTYDWKVILNSVENELAKFSCDTEISKARKCISDKCYDGAANGAGIYRLNVPTGGGKTLSSLRYALRHSCLFNKKRIIYVMPLLSIIEQNADVIKKFVQNDDIILEHHSNVVEAIDGEMLDRREFLTETWDAPIIITTLVQMLNTMFKDKTTSVRRFKSLCDSTIIFDEVQTVPPKMLSLFNLVCNFLSKVGNCTIILCSATQPCLEKIEHSITKDSQDLITLDDEILKYFERTELIDKGKMDVEGIIDFAEKVLEDKQSLLIICNTKAEANNIYEDVLVEGAEKVYLSANMCCEHRKATIQDIRNKLREGKKILCVSTQVIEAGVDVSFACVIRLKAGMDSIIQAAGRCNRNGELAGRAPVYVIELLGENLSKLPDINYAKNATTALFVQKKINDKFFDITTNTGVAFYYNKLYKTYSQAKANYHDFYYKKGDFYIFDKLATNKNYCSYNHYLLSHAFKTAGKAFEVFENQTKDILVPYGLGESLVADLCSERAKYDLGFVKERMKAAKGYTIGLYNYQIDKLLELGALTKIEDLDLYVLNKDNYDSRLGVVLEQSADFNLMMV